MGEGELHVLLFHQLDSNPQPVSFDAWMDKENVMDIHIMKYYSVIQNKEILPFVTTWMKLEGVMLSEESQIKNTV